MIRAFCLLVLIAVFSGPPSVHAQELSSGLSTDVIEITSQFTGTDIVLFGAIESAAAAPVTDRMRDVVVVIRGPSTDITVRRKERMAGLWLNRQQIAFGGLPGYYFLASTRPLSEIAPVRTLERFGLGSAHLEATTSGDVDNADKSGFLAAAIRSYGREGLYQESGAGIEFLSRTLFRARVPLPATVPSGPYKAEVYLFENGNVVGAQSTPLYVDKTGLERQVYNYAYRDSLLYGIATVLMALLMGWLGFALFRQRG